MKQGSASIPMADLPHGAKAVIELTDITRVYQMGMEQVRALDGVSLSIHEGGFWAIMGQSGSGKSTMLNILGCLDRPTSGTYRLAGQDVSDLNDQQLSNTRLKRIGFIFQSFHLIPQLTVQENIELPLFYLGWDKRKSGVRAKELAELVQMDHRLTHRPNELSGGQRQRVAIARSLVNDPAMILADEPTGNLDSATGEQIMTLLRQLNNQGKTIVMVTHEPDVAENADYRIVMKDGQVESITQTQPDPKDYQPASPEPPIPEEQA